MKISGLKIFSAMLIGLGGLMVAGGYRLVQLGGSPYYLLAGVAMMGSAALLFARRREGQEIYIIILLATIIWAIWESGLDGWQLLPRLGGPLLLGLWLVAICLLTPLKGRAIMRFPTALAAAVVAVALGAALHALMGKPSADPVYQTGMARPPSPSTTKMYRGDDFGDWKVWGENDGGARFSELTQITRDNVKELEMVWSYRIGSDSEGRTPRLSVTPLKIGRTVYVCSAWNDVIALDAESGKEKWRAKSNAKTDPYATCRGVAYYSVPDELGECANRIITATVDARLIAMDAESGQRCTNFGVNGEVSLSSGMGAMRKSYYAVVSAPIIVRGNIVVGSRVVDNQYWGEPSGVIRAFDAKTGAFSWAFDVGNIDRQTEPPTGETYTHSTPNSWAPMSADDELGLVFAPTGNPTNDYFGGYRRPFDDKFSSSVVAIEAETGKLRWSYQTLRHDVWDFDVPAQPVLVDLPRPDGQILPALVQATKRGELFVLNRETGRPIHQVVSKPVPLTGSPDAERLARTQPFSVGMPSLRGPDLSEKDMWGISPLDQLWCRIEFRKLRYDGTLTPPGLTPSIQTPGSGGGSNWGGIAIDTDRNVLVVNATRMPAVVRLMTRQEADRRGLEPYDINKKRHYAGGGPQFGTPYAVEMKWFLSPLEIPCSAPPFGTISGIDLVTGRLIWNERFGSAENSGPFGLPSFLPIKIGVPSVGGPMTTRAGLTFIAATQERHFRALDTRTGEILWDTVLPAGGHAVPITYISPESGRQFVAIAAGGFDALRSKEGDYIVAYALTKK